MSDQDVIYELDWDALRDLLVDLSYERFRVEQIWNWLYRKQVASFEEMTNIPRPLRSELDNRFRFPSLKPSLSQQSSDGQTMKVLFQLADGHYIETVLMRYKKRRTICLSTQSGCAMGCVFCATGQMGYFRNLTLSEIVGQVFHFARELSKIDERVTNIVLMGMGEPFHNYENTLSALDRLTDTKGFKLGARRITVSTVGLVPAIRRYAEEGRQSPLAISLHAATDEERAALIPVARRWPLADLLEACQYYIAKTNRRLTFEWALIDGENDTPEQAHSLGQLIRGLLCHVNLIPLNQTAGYAGRPSSIERVTAFQKVLQEYGISSTVRVRRGIDIQAGCGQLRDRQIAILSETNGDN